MNLRGFLSAGLLAISMVAFALTDDEVINYIRTQSANGKSQQDIGKELLAQGVTKAQVNRIRAKYSEEGSAAVGTSVIAPTATIQSNGRTTVVESAAQRTDGATTVDVFAPEAHETARRVYGRDVFNSRALSFEPNKNMATPQNYRLGPGDEVIIDMWGAAEEHLRETISPEGSIMISRLGPVHLNGKTIEEANVYIKNLFSRKYAGLSEEQTDISVNLGDIRSIQIDILGEVSTPGTFRLSPFSNVFHALYNAGGINNIGSMRNIYVLRNGKKVATVDIYDFLFNGKQTGNIRLQEGDVIIVPPYNQIVNISGNVKRPMYYEIKPGETVARVLEYAGGFSADAYPGMIRLSRQNGEENELYNIEKAEFTSYRLQDGDVLTVGEVLDRYSNRVELKGSVMRPGLYALGRGTTTLTEMINKADGLTEDAYKGRVLVYRQLPDLSLKVIPVDLLAVDAGLESDLVLEKNDVIEISSVQTMQERGDFTISGYVGNPGSYSYMENTTVPDLIVRAGGLREGASTARIDIARRIVDPTALQENNQIAEICTVNLFLGLDKHYYADEDFVLKPYDHVTVRRSPGYGVQQTVTVDGEVLFPGNYTLQKRNERITDLIARTGGILDGAYTRGAYLRRVLTDDERHVRENVIRTALMNSVGEDSISRMKIDVATTYSVGIDLPKALNNPGSSYDMVMKPGDYIFVPEEQSTVKISGDVMYPNTVIYEPGKKVSYYIDQAGGYGVQAKKSKAFVIYMNGQIARVGRNTTVEPGCHIIVPSKHKNNINYWERVIPLITGLGSTATIAAAIAAMLKK